METSFKLAAWILGTLVGLFLLGVWILMANTRWGWGIG